MTLYEALQQCAVSDFVKVIVNHKFSLFNCTKGKITDKTHYDYIKYDLDAKIEKIIRDNSHKGYKTTKIYVNSLPLENWCLKLENMWYDENEIYIRRNRLWFANVK